MSYLTKSLVNKSITKAISFLLVSLKKFLKSKIIDLKGNPENLLTNYYKNYMSENNYEQRKHQKVTNEKKAARNK